jgi:hypothetical protein
VWSVGSIWRPLVDGPGGEAGVRKSDRRIGVVRQLTEKATLRCGGLELPAFDVSVPTRSLTLMSNEVATASRIAFGVPVGPAMQEIGEYPRFQVTGDDFASKICICGVDDSVSPPERVKDAAR